MWITSEGDKVKVSPAKSPRSYVIDTPTGIVRRNRQHLNVASQKPEDSEPESKEQSTEQSQPNQIVTRSQTGMVMKPPKRLYSLRGETWQY